MEWEEEDKAIGQSLPQIFNSGQFWIHIQLASSGAFEISSMTTRKSRSRFKKGMSNISKTISTY